MTVKQLKVLLGLLRVRADEVLEPDDMQTYNDRLIKLGRRITADAQQPEFHEDLRNVPDDTRLEWLAERMRDQLIMWLERHGVSCAAA